MTRRPRARGSPFRASARPPGALAAPVLAAAIGACELGGGEGAGAEYEYGAIAGASTPLAIAERGPADSPGGAAAAARAYVSARAGELGLAAEDDFQLVSVARGPGDARYVRLAQTRAGARVWGAGVVVRTLGDEIVGLSGDLVPDLAMRGDGGPTLDRDEALAAAAATPRAVGPADRERAELVVFPRPGGRGELAWRIERFAEARGGAPPTRARQIISAETGAELFSYDAIAAARTGSGPGGNRRVSRRWEGALDVSAGCGAHALRAPRLLTVDMDGRSTGPGRPIPGSPSCVPHRAANDAHGFAGLALDMLEDWMERDSIDDGGARIVSRVSYSEGYANAFWDGERVTYGDGGDAFFPLSGDPAVVGHEIAHGFTEHHADLVFAGQPGALNESFSDVAGAALSYYADGEHGTAPRLAIGADVTKAGEPIRDLCRPGRDGRSIEHAEDYEEGMYLHAASGVPSRAFCLAARALTEREGGTVSRRAVRRAARVWFEANAGFWTRKTDFDGGCRGVLGAAELLGFTAREIRALAEAWEAVGVDCARPPSRAPAAVGAGANR